MKNVTLNVIKAIASFLVVFIHCKFPGKFGSLIESIGRVAVPIFLLISGFFSYNNDEMKLKRKINHIFLLLLVSSIVYFLWKIGYRLSWDNSLIKLFVKDLFTFETIINFIIFNDNPIRTHLWFLSTILYCYLIMYLYTKFIKPKAKKDISKYLIILSFLLLVGYVVIWKMYLLYDTEKLFSLRNFIFVGIPFFYIGNFINRYNLKDKFSNMSIGLIIAIAYVFLLGEFKIYYSELYISTILLALGIFIFAIKNPNMLNNKCLEKIGDKYSVYIYLYHLLAADIIMDYIYEYVYTQRLFLTDIKYKALMFAEPIIILIVSIILSILIRKIVDFMSYIKQKLLEN